MSVDMWWVQTVTVETCTGTGAYGEVFAAPVPVLGFVDDSTKVVRNAKGEEVVASTTVYTSTANADTCTEKSRVTYGGRTSRVVAVNSYDGDDFGLPSHMEVHLT